MLRKANFGDCFAYALAKFTGEPLLFIATPWFRSGCQLFGSP